MPFETSGALAAPNLSGTISGFITEVGGVEPTGIIRADQDWKIHVKWELRGKLTEFVCGKWCVNAYLESIGPGEELKLPEGGRYLDLDPEAGPNAYALSLTIPAGTVRPEHCSSPYKLVTTVTYLTPKGRPGPMAGFVEGPIVQFYQP